MEKYMEILDELHIMEIMTELSYEIYHKGQCLEYREHETMCHKIADVELALERLKTKINCQSEVKLLKNQKKKKSHECKNILEPNRSIWFED